MFYGGAGNDLPAAGRGANTLGEGTGGDALTGGDGVHGAEGGTDFDTLDLLDWGKANINIMPLLYPRPSFRDGPGQSSGREFGGW